MIDLLRKQQAIACFTDLGNVSSNDVINIIESIQRCYDSSNEKEEFLVDEVQSFITGIKGGN